MVSTDVEQLISAMAEMREVIAEAHGVQKDLERTLRDAREFLAKEVEREVQGRIEQSVTESVDALGKQTVKTMDECTDKVISEFDRLFKILTGATRDMQRRGNMSVQDMVHAIAEAQDSPFGPIYKEPQ